MTPPVRPSRFDAVGFAKAARAKGFTTDEIAAKLEQLGATQYATEIRRAGEGSARNTGLQAAEGMLQGVGRPLVAGVGAAAQKFGEEVDEMRGKGEARPFGQIYGQLKDDLDNRDSAFRERNSGKALTANVIGSAIGAVTNPLTAGRATPVIGKYLPSVVTRGGRAASSAINAGATGTVVGAVNSDAETLGGRAMDGITTGGLSALAGGVLQPGMELVGSTARALTPKTVREYLAQKAGQFGQSARETAADATEAIAGRLPAAAPGTAVAPRGTPALDRLRSAPREALEGATASLRGPRQPIDRGAMRLLSRMQALRMGMGTLDENIAKADGPDMLFETLGDKGVRDAEQMYILGNRTDPVVNTIKERARGENGRVAERIRERTGVGQLDARTLNDTYVATRGPLVGKLNTETSGLAANKDMVRNIAETAADLQDRGLNIWKSGVAISKEFPRTPLLDPENNVPLTDMTLGQLRTLRKALDGHINYGRNPLNTNSAEAMAGDQLVSLRKLVNRAIKDAGGDPAGRQKAAIADEMVHDLKRGVEAFQKGEDVDAETAAELLRLAGEDGKPNLFQMGRASGLAKSIAGKRDGGAGGTVQNPIETLVGSDKARMNNRAAFKSEADWEATLQDAENVNRRLSTSQRVLGGSPTARRLGDMAEQVAGPVNPMEVLNAVANPQAAVAGGLSRLWNPVARRFLGEEMDAMQPYMLAGGPGQMTKEEAARRLRELEPAIVQMMTRRAARSAAAGAQLGREGRGR